MAVVGEDPTIFTTDALPSDTRLLPTMTNAYLGTRVYRDILHVNGVYNGAVGQTHRADLPSPVNVRMDVDGANDLRETFCLDTRTGTYIHTAQCSEYTATHTIYAHQSLLHLLAFSITISRSALETKPITVNLHTQFTPESPDLDLQKGPDFLGAHYLYGKTLVPEVEGGPQPTVHMVWTPVPQSVTLPGEKKEQRWEFLTAIAETEEDVQRTFCEGMSLIGSGSLHLSHVQAWAALWEGCCVDVEGPLPFSQAIYGCLYYLLSAIPPLGSANFPFSGISPGGLSNGTSGEDYWGHVFWDQDTWIYPNILLFYPEAACAILKYRIRTLEGAQHNAWEQGYKGAKFPWESAATGREVCPEKIYGDEEIHINGDVMLAFEQYFYITQDLKLFQQEGGWDVVQAIAQYWCSRVVWNSEEENYYIVGVMPPDEYHCSVNNSVYTNAVAQRSLNFAIDLGSQLHFPVPEEWKEIMKKLKVPLDKSRCYHPEYDGYCPGEGFGRRNQGEPVKQADVVLLGFPVVYPMDPEVRRNDLEIYEPVTDPQGPAMTWSMFAVGWLELKEIKRAQQQMSKCFSNITEPFKIWVENSDGSGAVNFLTGMGGFLQAIFFGYAGFRISRSCLKFDPVYPDDIKQLNITGVCYLGNKLNFTLTKEKTTIKMTRSSPDLQLSVLEVVLAETGEHLSLKEGQSVSFFTTAGWIQKASIEPF
ncbi:protein-glucosylgalactosylhydroxylysine glucosidase isoform X3 [Python bivittatus]|uniref:Protein-glucosylgalactosylhydroxylysine glucosidase n=1 Tax=Python bivittatus TaxID=176946 RepID=A0A9F5JE39_PYTBI|nr:protein-glucosylgalactosylhydroxylysine glucosidase isoform X3 [Python bivittatus]